MEERVHKACAYPNKVVCEFKNKDGSCPNCIDVTAATNFLLKKLRPASGTLKTGSMNNDYAALLMTEFFNQHPHQ